MQEVTHLAVAVIAIKVEHLVEWLRREQVHEHFKRSEELSSRAENNLLFCVHLHRREEEWQS